MDDQSDVTSDQVATLTEIWRATLDDPSIDETSDVFEHGGTSLHVLQVAGAIYQRLGTSVSLRDIFTYTTPRRLAARLYGDLDDASESRNGAAS